MVEQTFLSAQLKQGVIISNKLVYTSWLTRCQNDLRIKALEN